jgi:hypothetical protein
MKSVCYNLIFPSIIIFSLLLTSACSDSSTDAGTSDTAVIQGSVQPSSSQQSEGIKNEQPVVVSAARITSDGSFETLSGTSVEADADLRFTLEVDVSANEKFAVVAETDGEVRKAVIPSGVENGDSYTLMPLTAESTGKAMIQARIVSSGNADIVTKADTEASVSNQAAVSAAASTTAANRIAAGLTAYANARGAFTAEFTSENPETFLNAASELRFQALAQLESSLASATSESQIEAAINTYLESSTDAYISAGMDETTAAKVAHMRLRVMMNSTTTLSSEVRNHVRARVAYLASISSDTAVRAEAAASGMSQTTVQAIADAGVTLRSEIRSGSGASSEISAAFEAYHEAVRDAIENDASTEASVVIAINSEINATGGARTIFNSAITGAVDASVLVEAYKLFLASIESTVNSHSEAAGDIDTEAFVRLMLLINLGA